MTSLGGRISLVDVQLGLNAFFFVIFQVSSSKSFICFFFRCRGGESSRDGPT